MKNVIWHLYMKYIVIDQDIITYAFTNKYVQVSKMYNNKIIKSCLKGCVIKHIICYVSSSTVWLAPKEHYFPASNGVLLGICKQHHILLVSYLYISQL